MKRRRFLLGASAFAAGCTANRSRRLNVYNWENYVAAGTIPGFEREFHCTVRYATYGSAEEMLSKVIGGNSGWDVVFPSNSFVQPMHELDLLEPLDHARLPNLANLEQRFQRPDWDPDLRWCTPYMYSSTGIVYAKRVSPTPLAWADLWKNDYHRRVTMMDDPAEVFGACLKRLGDSVNATSEKQLKRRAIWRSCKSRYCAPTSAKRFVTRLSQETCLLLKCGRKSRKWLLTVHPRSPLRFQRRAFRSTPTTLASCARVLTKS